MNIVGVSAFFHESAACLLRDGSLVAAAAEERFTRIKHDRRLPVSAYRYCLDTGGISVGDIDVIAFYESPKKKLERQRSSGHDFGDEQADEPERMIREHLGFDGPIHYFDHHLSHAASAFFSSGFDEAALLTVDGVGEWATTTYGRGDGTTIDLFDEVRFPHSLGLLYATITAYLGFKVNDGEYKVMGLAPYGTPRFVDAMHELIEAGADGQFLLDMDYFDFVAGETMYSSRLAELFGAPPRSAKATLEPFHADVASSAQVVLEELLLAKVGYLAAQVDSANLCMAGGVALNCVASGRIRREGPFDELFIPPDPGDAGACLGAAALAHVELTGRRPTPERMTSVDHGPSFSPTEIIRVLRGAAITFIDYRDREKELVDDVAQRLQNGEVIGWFQGGMEFGPRALGFRSILADPTHPDMRELVNARVKRRESFRPFAPSVLAEHAVEHFELDHDSPFMLETCQVRSPLALPAITHVNGSARPQTVDAATNPRYRALLEAFHRRTGCPILLNTSLNVAGEPLVLSPVDALICLANANLSALVLGDFVIDRGSVPENWRALLGDWDIASRSAFGESRGAIIEHLYTFV